MIKLTLLIFAMLLALPMNGQGASEPCGVFSWKKNAVKESGAFFETIERAGITEVYQMFSKDLDEETVKTFLEEADARDVTVYALCGAPEWVLEPDGDPLREECSRIFYWNSLVDASAHIRGVVVDVEPYLLDAWDEDEEDVMEAYLTLMTECAGILERRDFAFIPCIPFYYDTMGHKPELKRLFQLHCSAVAVMNYLKSNEAEQLSTEARYAERYGRELIVIYELQAPEGHGLKPRNTYYHEGLGGIRASWEKLSGQLKDARCAIHDYRALKEALTNE